jgi:ElaB/YqjD/DUF883 family membrane-anchored ribosome-binding protein
MAPLCRSRTAIPLRWLDERGTLDAPNFEFHIDSQGAVMNDIVSKEKLVADLKVVVADTEELLRATAGQAGEKVSVIRDRLQEHLATAKSSLADAQAAMVDRAKQVGRYTDDYVHDNPWRSVGIAAGFGLIVGLLIGRR